jgi:hypothetical protein
MDPIQHEKGLSNLIADLKKSALKDPSFLSNRDVLSALMNCTLVPKVSSEALSIVGKAPK